MVRADASGGLILAFKRVNWVFNKLVDAVGEILALHAAVTSLGALVGSILVLQLPGAFVRDRPHLAD